MILVLIDDVERWCAASGGWVGKCRVFGLIRNSTGTDDGGYRAVLTASLAVTATDAIMTDERFRDQFLEEKGEG